MKNRILFVAILLPLVYNAQEKEKEIEDIQVYGKMMSTPYKDAVENIEIISKSEIENSPARSIDEILQLHAGMDIRRRGSNGIQADISIRGGSFEQTLILINGVRMNDSQTGHNSMNIPVDVKNVERIEIIKGPAARRFGQNAYSGVINIITKTSAEESVKISASAGDFETYNLGINATLGNEKITHLFQANSGSSNGYRHNTDYEIRNAFYQNQLKIKDGNLNFQAGIQEKKFGANGFYASPNATEQYEETQASVVAINLRKNFGKWNFTSGINWRRSQDMYEYIRDKPEIYRNMHIGNNLGAEINSNYHSNFGITGIGAELRKEYLASNNLGHRNRFLTQLFFEHQFSLLENKLKIIPGVSWANYSDSGNFFYPGLDLGYQFNPYHKIYGNVAKVHRIPTFTDLYYKSPTEQGYENLQPENAISSELGYQFSKNKIEAKISGFLRNSNNAIDWVKASETAPWTAQNVGEILLKGVETSLQHQPISWLDYSISYTFIETDYTIKNAEFSRYAMENLKHQLISRLGVQFLKNFRNEISYRYMERNNSGNYNIIDEQMNYKANGFDVFVLINNVTNVEYTETFGVPMPGRWFHFGVSYTL